jgi:hypothetical protein
MPQPKITLEEVRELMPESAKAIALTPGATYLIVVKRGTSSLGNLRKLAARFGLVNIDAVILQCDDVDDTVRVLEIKAAGGESGERT